MPLIRIALRYEIDNLAAKVVGPNSPPITRRFFNATHTLTDGAGNQRPYLAEALPELNSSSWQVFSDGRMETTYRLRPNLTWQDGQPLTSADFVLPGNSTRFPGSASSRPTHRTWAKP